MEILFQDPIVFTSFIIDSLIILRWITLGFLTKWTIKSTRGRTL